ncbi:MAG: Uma2 family endonuclease [Gemmataceae bacterium]|nr:Uma2 family endonuclease [Gemmataceae bacterium]
MSIMTPPIDAIYQPPPYPVHKFTVDEYHQMIQVGLLTEEDSVELLEGWIVPKMPRNSPHDIAIELLQEALGDMLPADWRLRIQSAVTLPDSEPEPDVALVRGNARSRGGRHPGASDVGLIVEVADSSLIRDRQEKARLYARAAIVVYWIVNVADAQVEV